MNKKRLKDRRLTEAERIAEIITREERSARYGNTAEVNTKKVLEGETDDFVVDERKTENIAKALEDDKASEGCLAVREVNWLRSVYGEAFRHIQRESASERYSDKAKQSLEKIYRGQRDKFLGPAQTDVSTTELKKSYKEATEELRSPAELVSNLESLALETGTPDLDEAKKVAEDAAIAHARIDSALGRIEDRGYPRVDLYQEERTAKELFKNYVPQPV